MQISNISRLHAEIVPDGEDPVGAAVEDAVLSVKSEIGSVEGGGGFVV
jgi:hypothetical protein